MLTEIKKEVPMGCGSITQQAEYPWGTRLTFSNEMVNQLGLRNLDVGTKVMITAEAVINSKTQNEGVNDNYQDVGVQLTAVIITPDRSNDDRVDILYKG